MDLPVLKNTISGRYKFRVESWNPIWIELMDTKQGTLGTVAIL